MGSILQNKQPILRDSAEALPQDEVVLLVFSCQIHLSGIFRSCAAQPWRSGGWNPWCGWNPPWRDAARDSGSPDRLNTFYFESQGHLPRRPR